MRNESGTGACVRIDSNAKKDVILQALGVKELFVPFAMVIFLRLFLAANTSDTLRQSGAPFERTLLTRIVEYRKNYFTWVEDFSLPSTYNFAERSLRSIKSHMKISGQFESEAAADHHILIRTYIETCHRNQIRLFDEPAGSGHRNTYVCAGHKRHSDAC